MYYVILLPMPPVQQSQEWVAPLKIAAMLLLADAQDPDEELVTLAALKLAKQEQQSNKFGH